MASTSFPNGATASGDWRAAGLRFLTRNFFWRRVFGCRVRRIGIDGGFSCPNREATSGQGGCIFCNPASFSPARRGAALAIRDQIDEAVGRLGPRYGADRFVAYFQPATNTYASVERLEKAYTEALAHPRVVGLIVGTRPDCVPEDVLTLLEALSRRTWLSIEYGLQSIHDRTLDWLNRGHRYDAFLDAVGRSRSRGLRVGAHLILGLPEESPKDMLATAREIARLRIDSVKLHNLQAVRGTALADMVAAGKVDFPAREEYVGYVVDFLEQLPPDCVIDRLSGDAPPQFLLAPRWCLDKSAVRRAVEAELRRRDAWQGCKYRLPADESHRDGPSAPPAAGPATS